MTNWFRRKLYYIGTMGFKRRRSETGFTLVEVLVVVAITGLLISAAGSLIITSTRVQTAAVKQSGFTAKSQRLLSSMIDGKTGLISAKDYQIWGPQNGYDLALTYVVNVGGTDTVFSYQYAQNSICKSEPVSGSAMTAPSETGTQVLNNVDHFLIDESEAPKIAIEIGSAETVLRTAVTLRNTV